MSGAPDPYAAFSSPAQADPYAAFSSRSSGPAAHKLTVGENVSGFMANLNRGLGIGDELHAGMVTAGDALDGNVHGLGDLPRAFKANMARERQTEDAYTAAHPVAANMARGSGNALTMAAPIGPGAEVFAQGGRAVNALRGATVAGLAGAGYAAVDRGTPAERLGAAGRAAMDPATLALGAGAGALARGGAPKAKAKASVPSLGELDAQKNAAYDKVRASGESYSPDAFKGLTEDMASAVDAEGFNAGLHPKTAAFLERLGQSNRAVGGYAPTLDKLDQLRQQVGRDVASSPDAGERRMGSIMRDQIDRFIEAQGGSPDLLRARDLNTRVAKLRSLDQLDEAAADRAAASGSGGNVNNASRQNVIRFQKATGNLTPDEAAATRHAIRGSVGGNALRQVGKLSPEGNGLGMTVHLVGAAASHGTSLPIAVGGFVAKRAADLIQRNNVQALRDLIASGGEAASEVARQLAADPQAGELRRQLANDLAAQSGVQGAAASAQR